MKPYKINAIYYTLFIAIVLIGYFVVDRLYYDTTRQFGWVMILPMMIGILGLMECASEWLEDNNNNQSLY